MAALDYPNSPTGGQGYQGWIWDGEKWVISTGGAVSDPAKTYVDQQDALRVAKAGDTMSGNLNINAGLYINNGAMFIDMTSTASSGVVSTRSTKRRWYMEMLDAVAESGSNAGSDFSIYRHNDAGVSIGKALSINRANGAMTITGDFVITKTDPSIVFDGQGLSSTLIASRRNGAQRWMMEMAAGSTESSGNNGSDFKIHRYGDNGIFLSTAMSISRVNGDVTLSGRLSVNGGICWLTGPIPNLIMNATGGGANTIFGQRNGANRWRLDMGDGGADNLSLTAFNDSGTQLYPSMSLLRADGSVRLNNRAYIGTGAAPSYHILDITFSGGGTQYGISMLPAIGAATTNAIDFYNVTPSIVGAIVISATGTGYQTASGAELKEDLKSFDAGSIIDNTKVYDFKWKDTSERAYGVIAQQAVEVYPQAVAHTQMDDGSNEFWGVDYSKYVPVLLQELKALRERVAILEGGSVAPKQQRQGTKRRG